MAQIEYTNIIEAGTDLQRMEAALTRTQSYYPYRIVWGYIDNTSAPTTYPTFADVTKRQMNKAIRDGKRVYRLQ